ncbi:MAG: carbohydrate porin [Rhodoferax sp.]|uniref:carbohydrate porin n=1 Tax=Rhodoferax sp. TaxID=50421 RepID=UPI002615B03E|nr:carbohydrate porin [Rhodoferax sp.]MDD5333975.1 carbohydrate porin [Rhodoferax sp.]
MTAKFDWPARFRRCSQWGGLALALSVCPARAFAQANPEETPGTAFHAQTTYIWQAKPAFSAAYSGPNSLSPLKERSYSFTLTGDLGLRLWDGAQLHLNPEGAQGLPLSNLQGAGGISNGELARGSGASLAMYRARFFVQQRINVGGDSQTVASDFNELGGQFSARRWTFTFGNFSLLDYFDNNPYAKDPRSQFTNWSFLTHGAWDYAADARGYTLGAVAEYRAPGWALRAGRAMQPIESNGLALDAALGRHYGDQLEVEGELPLTLAAGPLRGRALLFRNRIQAGSFTDALALAGVPDVGLVRRDQSKSGWGLTLEAPLADDAGLFLRASRNSGKLETYAFAEIDRQLALGGQFSGASWGRSQDRWGVAYAVNGLSDPHQAYLAAGGQGFFLGDGQLNYDQERVLEAYYRLLLSPWDVRLGKVQSALSAGFQRISNPGYNRDRGPVSTYTLRWHSEF